MPVVPSLFIFLAWLFVIYYILICFSVFFPILGFISFGKINKIKLKEQKLTNKEKDQ